MAPSLKSLLCTIYISRSSSRSHLIRWWTRTFFHLAGSGVESLRLFICDYHHIMVAWSNDHVQTDLQSCWCHLSMKSFTLMSSFHTPSFWCHRLGQGLHQTLLENNKYMRALSAKDWSSSQVTLLFFTSNHTPWLELLTISSSICIHVT